MSYLGNMNLCFLPRVKAAVRQHSFKPHFRRSRPSRPTPIPSTSVGRLSIASRRFHQATQHLTGRISHGHLWMFAYRGDSLLWKGRLHSGRENLHRSSGREFCGGCTFDETPFEITTTSLSKTMSLDDTRMRHLTVNNLWIKPMRCPKDGYKFD